MVSIWKNVYIIKCLQDDFEEHLKSYGENNLNVQYKVGEIVWHVPDAVYDC